MSQSSTFQSCNFFRLPFGNFLASTMQKEARLKATAGSKKWANKLKTKTNKNYIKKLNYITAKIPKIQHSDTPSVGIYNIQSALYHHATFAP